jgi:hypothetical protein
MRVVIGIVLALAALLAPPVTSGQAPTSSAGPKKVRDEEKPIQIVLYPAAAPRPALKYQLLPPFLERKPGNAAVWWNRIFAEYSTFHNNLFKQDGVRETLEKWMEMPIGDPREKEFREKELAKEQWCNVGLFSSMDRAARFESCDWELPIRDGHVLSMDFSDMLKTGDYARLLAAKARLEIAEGTYDQALRTLQGGYAQARHMAEGPTMISGFVGLSAAELMCQQVEQWVQRPSSPNLYWALSALPRPPVSLRLAAEAEPSFFYLQWPELRDLDKKKLSTEGWRELLGKTMADVNAMMGSYGSKSRLDASSPTFTMSVVQTYPRAKRYLVERGRSAAEVEAMPVAQVFLLYLVTLHDEVSDEQYKWFFLPTTEAGKEAVGVDQRLWEAVDRELIPFAGLFIFGSTNARMAETRLQCRICILRLFEAMRLYAAGHDGRWPDQLSDVTEAPVPVNPFTGKPFTYELHGNRAVVIADNGPWWAARRYEIALMSKEK